jgi:hypothetical protein
MLTNYISEPYDNKKQGYLAAIHLQNTPGSEGSSWVRATPTPIPAAAWLFGSGLLGMIGLRRKKSA